MRGVPIDGWWVASYVVLWTLVIVLAVMVVALARQIGTLHLRLGPRGALEMDDEGPPLGDAPELIDALDLSGHAVEVGGPRHEQLLLFVSPGCLVCEQVLPSLGAVASTAGISALVISEQDAHETKRAFADKRVGVPVIASRSIFERYRVPGTPYLVVLDELGVVRGKGTVNNLEQMEGLIDTARRRIQQSVEARRAS